MKAHGVPWLIRHLNGEITLDEVSEGARMDTRRYAKRQVTWFKGQMKDWPSAPPPSGAKRPRKPVGGLTNGLIRSQIALDGLLRRPYKPAQ